MEKHKPHRKLHVVKALIAAGKVRATGTAFAGARDVGINSLAAMCDVVNALEPWDFYKSMTTYADHRVWQDVYHARLESGLLCYLKLTVVDDLLIVSFKENEK